MRSKIIEAHKEAIAAAGRKMAEATARNACALDGLCAAIGRSNGELKAALTASVNPAGGKKPCAN